METTLENAFTSALTDLVALRRTDLDLEAYTRRVDVAVGLLCDAAESGEDVRALACRAHRVVFELVQVLDGIDCDDRRTRDKLDLARGAVEELLDALEPMVDRALRDVVLRECV